MDIKRRILLPVLSLLLVLGLPLQSDAATGFADIGGKEFEQHVNYIAGKGIISGYSENGTMLFKPMNHVTRFQAAKMLVIASENEGIQGADIRFSDVKNEEEQNYISKAVKLGYFSGYQDGKFRPHEPLTRGQMSKVMARAFNLKQPISLDNPLMFADTSLSYPYVADINALYYNGISQGSNGNFLSERSLTRGQFAMFLSRAMDKKFRISVPALNKTVIANGKVNTGFNHLNIRNAPSTSGTVIGNIKPGTLFAVVKNDQLKTSDWVQIRYEKGPAYINANDLYVTFLDHDKNEIGSATHSVKVNTKSSTDTTLNVRTEPSVNGIVLGQLKNGNVVQVYGESNGWHLIIFNGIPGYIQSAYTEKVQAPSPAPSGNLNGTVTVNSLNVRQSASDSSASLGKLNKGAVVKVHGVSGWWANIDYNGRSAYVHKAFLKLKNTSGSVLKNRIIVVDAGHGGRDPGTSKAGVTEKAIVLKVSQKVEQKLKDAGATVYMTRVGDTYPTLQNRVNYAEQKYAESFVSIHVNAAGSSSARGAEVFFDTSVNMNGVESKVLAQDIQNRLVRDVGMYNRGAKDTAFYVIRNQHVPAVLVELGFITNPNDFNKLTNDAYLEKFAQAIYQGIVDYYAK